METDKMTLLTDRNPELADPEIRRTFEEEALFGEVTDTLEALVASSGMTRKELANRLDISPGRVSQILNGGGNLTLRSLAAFGWGLGLRFELSPEPMMDRRGTPACDDPPPPAWLMNQDDRAHITYGQVEMPAAGRVARARTPMEATPSTGAA